MMKDLAMSLVFPPNRLRSLGALMSQLGFAMTILGVFSQIGLKAVAQLQSIGHVVPTSTGIESILLGLPTWFIPESAAGFAFCVTVTALGLYFQYLAKEIKRIYF